MLDVSSYRNIHINDLYSGEPADSLVGHIVINRNPLIFTRMRARHEGEDKMLAQARAVYRVKRKGGI